MPCTDFMNVTGGQMDKYICFIVDRPYHVLDSIEYMQNLDGKYKTIAIVTNKYSGIGYNDVYDKVVFLDLKSAMYKHESYIVKFIGYLYRAVNNFILYRSLRIKLKNIIKLPIVNLFVYNDCEMINQAIIDIFYEKSETKITLMDEGIALYYKPDKFNEPKKSIVKSMIFYKSDIIEFGCNKKIKELICYFPDLIMNNKKENKYVNMRKRDVNISKYIKYFDFKFDINERCIVYISSPIINEYDIKVIKSKKKNIINELNLVCENMNKKLVVKLHPAEIGLNIEDEIDRNITLIKNSIPVEIFSMFDNIDCFVSEYSSALINLSHMNKKCYFLYEYYGMNIPNTLDMYFKKTGCKVIGNMNDINVGG